MEEKLYDMRYQTHLPTIALAYGDNHRVAVTIPAGKMMNVVGQGDDNRFLVVEVDGEQLQVFETDLMNHSSPRTERGRRARLSRPLNHNLENSQTRRNRTCLK